MTPSSLSPTELMAAASRCLEEADYSRIEGVDLPAGGAKRFYEDSYGVVLTVVYETWAELAETWSEDQARLVELMSAHMSHENPKAWEGYLVLLCPASPPPEDMAVVEQVRYDTTRVRKLIAVGSDLSELAGVERAMLPLLPIAPPEEPEPEASALDLLPDVLEEQGINMQDSQALISAFREQKPLIEALQDGEEDA